MTRAGALLLVLPALAGCQRDAPAETATPVPAATTSAPASAVPTAAESAAPLSQADKGEAGARKVLLAWAHDLETGDYDGAYRQWLDGSRSGLSQAEHAAYWKRFKTITVSAGEGEAEGAAGSSFYQVPVTLVGKQQDGHPYRLAGSVTLRRVNDVDGATPEQLRWHIETVELAPVS